MVEENAFSIAVCKMHSTKNVFYGTYKKKATKHMFFITVYKMNSIKKLFYRRIRKG